MRRVCVSGCGMCVVVLGRGGGSMSCRRSVREKCMHSAGANACIVVAQDRGGLSVRHAQTGGRCENKEKRPCCWSCASDMPGLHACRIAWRSAYLTRLGSIPKRLSVAFDW